MAALGSEGGTTSSSSGKTGGSSCVFDPDGTPPPTHCSTITILILLNVQNWPHTKEQVLSHVLGSTQISQLFLITSKNPYSSHFHAKTFLNED